MGTGQNLAEQSGKGCQPLAAILAFFIVSSLMAGAQIYAAGQGPNDETARILQSSELLALNTTPLLYDGSFAAKSMVDVWRVYARFKPAATSPVPYAVPSGTMIELFWGTVDTGCGIPATGLLDQTGSTFTTINCKELAVSTAGIKGSPINIQATHALTNGNGTLEVYLYYTVIVFGN